MGDGTKQDDALLTETSFKCLLFLLALGCRRRHMHAYVCIHHIVDTRLSLFLFLQSLLIVTSATLTYQYGINAACLIM